MAKQLRPSQLEALLSGDLNGNEFFALHRIGYNYSLTLGELKKYIGTGSSGGGSDIDLTSVASNIIPDSNGSRILGNTENAWQRLFLTDSIRFTSNGIIYGNVDVQGALTLNGQELAKQSSITNIAGIVYKIDARLEKVESAEGVDLSDYYTKDDVNDILKEYTTTSALQTDYVSVRGNHTITGTHTYNDGKLKVGQYVFGAGSSGITIDGGLIQTSLNSYTNSEIDDMIASVATTGKLGGMLNITDKTAIQNAQKLLTSTNQVAYYIITDSSGKLPSKQTCFDLSADIIKELSLTSPNTLTNAALSLAHGRVAVSPIGVNVGDMIAITRVKVKVDDLTATLGISLGLSGEIEMYQYRILSFNDAKAPNTNGITNGVMGLMTPSDKAEVTKIGGIEWTANHVRDNYLPKADLLPSIWGTNMNDCLSMGVYPWCTLGRPSGSTGAYTCIVKRTSTNDGSYDTIEQTAYGREGESGRVFKRIIFQHKNGSDTQYGDWIELGGSNSDYLTKAQADGYYLSKSGNGTVSGNLGVGGSLYGAYDVFSYTSGDGLYMSDNSINAHNKGSWTRQLFKFDKTNGRVEINNGFETDVTSYIGSASNVNHKALIFRRNGNGFRLNATNDAAYFSYGPLNSAKDEITPNAFVFFNGAGFKYSPDAVNYYDVLTSNSLKIGEYAFQDRAENRLASSTNLDNVSYGVWGTLDNTAYTNAPIQNFGLIVSRLNQIYKGQLILPYSSGHLQYRAQLYNNGKVEWSGWRALAFTNDIPSVAGFLKEGFSISNATITTLTTSTIKYTGGTSSAYWELTNQGGGGGNSPAFTKNLKIKENNTFYENVHAGNISKHAITDISGKQDTISDLATIRSNATNGNIAHGWGNHAIKGYATETYTINKINEIVAERAGGIPSYVRVASGSELGYLTLYETQANPADISSSSAVYYIADKGCFYIVALPNDFENKHSSNAYSVFDGSAFYNSSATSARKDCLFYNTTTKTVHRIGDSSVLTMVDSGNIETILSGKYLGKNDTAAAAYRLVSNSGSHVLYVDGNGYPTSNNILLFKNAAGSSNFGYVGRPNDLGVYVMTYGSSSVIFGTNSAERFRIDQNGNILIAKDKMLFFNNVNEGIYMHSTGISWHNSSNAWTKSLMTFSDTGVVNFPNSATIGGNSILHANNYSSYALPLSGGNITGAINTSSNITFTNTNGYHINYPGAKWSVSDTGAATFLSVSQTSDANMKNLMGDVNLSVNQIANAPAKCFTWNNNIQLGRQVGTVAQYWREVLPEVVIENEGVLGLNYASLAVVSSIILARSIETHEQRIARLEKEIATLTDELNSLVGKA